MILFDVDKWIEFLQEFRKIELDKEKREEIEKIVKKLLTV